MARRISSPVTPFPLSPVPRLQPIKLPNSTLSAPTPLIAHICSHLLPSAPNASNRSQSIHPLPKHPSALSAPLRSHPLAGGADGELCIWRTSDWECLLRMKGHRAAVLGERMVCTSLGKVLLPRGAVSNTRHWELTNSTLWSGTDVPSSRIHQMPQFIRVVVLLSRWAATKR